MYSYLMGNISRVSKGSPIYLIYNPPIEITVKLQKDPKANYYAFVVQDNPNFTSYKKLLTFITPAIKDKINCKTMSIVEYQPPPNSDIQLGPHVSVPSTKDSVMNKLDENIDYKINITLTQDIKFLMGSTWNDGYTGPVMATYPVSKDSTDKLNQFLINIGYVRDNLYKLGSNPSPHVSACTIMSQGYKTDRDKNKLSLLEDQEIPKSIKDTLNKEKPVFKPDKVIRDELKNNGWTDRIPVTDLIKCKEWIPKS